MKKTLVALAVLAASGASFAQVTITGTVAMGYQATKSTGTSFVNSPFLGLNNVAATAGNDAAGLGVDTTEIYFTATEDLGGGQKVEAKLGFDGTSRGSVGGGDTTLTYTNNSFGRIQLGTTKGDAIHSGIPSAGAPVIDMDGKIFEIRSSSDFISYAAPIGPVIFVYKISESSKGIGLGVGSAGLGGNPVGQRSSDLALVYSSGPVKVVGAYRSYDNRNTTNIATADGLTKDSVISLQAGYDAGFANFGFGYNVATASVGPKVDDVLIGVSVPAGAWTFGATFGMAKTSGVADTPASAFPSGSQLVKDLMQLADGTANSVSVGAKYDFSKRTNLSVKYATWTRSGYEQFEAWGARAAAGAAIAGLNEFGYTDKASQTSILLAHSF